MNGFNTIQLANGFWYWLQVKGTSSSFAGSCTGDCSHLTREAAIAHESSRVRALLQAASKKKIADHLHYICMATGSCTHKAVYVVDCVGSSYSLCEEHANDFSWYEAYPHFTA